MILLWLLKNKKIDCKCSSVHVDPWDFMYFILNISHSLDTVKYINPQAHDFNGAYSSFRRYLWNSMRFSLIFALYVSLHCKWVTCQQKLGGSSLISLILLGVQIITVISDLAEIQGLHRSAILSCNFRLN